MKKIAVTKWNGQETDVDLDQFLRSYLYQLDYVRDVARHHGEGGAFIRAQEVMEKILTEEFNEIHEVQQSLGVFK